MGSLVRSSWRTILGAAVGAVGGGLYAHFVGCRTGTCLLTSNVWTAALFFGVTGAVALSPSRPKERPAPERTSRAEP
jgi:hypothetical protein